MKGDFRPPRRDGRSKSKSRRKPPHVAHVRERLHARRAREKKIEQPADVADDDVSRRDRIALGLADRTVRQ